MDSIRETNCHDITDYELKPTSEFYSNGKLCRVAKLELDGGSLVDGGHTINLFLSDTSDGILKLPVVIG